jgi:plastocyanin
MKQIAQLKLILTIAGIVAITSLAAVLVLLSLRHPRTPAAEAPPPATVTVTKDGFAPASLVVKAGAKVTWEADDDHSPAHWIEADPYPNPAHPADLSSGRLMDEMQYTYTFTKPGTYHYHDRLNPTHSATIIVQ